MNSTILIRNARLAGEARPDAWVLICGDRIADVGHGAAPQADVTIDAEGALLMPGVIDCHVHFREPGLTHKADIASESRAAIAGGVTSFCDMPNTVPPTTTLEAWQEKCEIAQRTSAANYAFFIGATNSNIPELLRADYSRIPGVKLFMGSSTGNMLVDSDDAIAALFSKVSAIVAVHAEDQAIIAANAAEAKEKYPEGVPVAEHSRIRSAEACCACTARAIELADRYQHRLHVCHLSTAREVDMIASHSAPGTPVEEKMITCEVSPHHLLWCDEDYPQRGTRIKMNPAVKTRADRDALRQALIDGRIDMVATDHAPHCLADKEGDALTAASGAPLVQFSLPLMLSLFPEEVVQRTMCHNPALIYRIVDRGFIRPGAYADLVLVRECEPYTITDADVISKCGWTPASGLTVRHRIARVILNGCRGTAVPLAFRP